MEKKILDNFPQQIPLFPLEGVVMFPNTYLPLNIFEPRYLKMINKAISSDDRLIGIIQPKPLGLKNSRTSIYDIGCAGKIVKFEEIKDDRYLITLKGISRFNIIKQKVNMQNFRIADVDWRPFAQDLIKVNHNDNFFHLKIALKKYLKLNNINFNMEIIDKCEDLNLADQIAMICPITSKEKQLLLETLLLSKRNHLLLSMLESYNKEANLSDIIKH